MAKNRQPTAKVSSPKGMSAPAQDVVATVAEPQQQTDKPVVKTPLKGAEKVAHLMATPGDVPTGVYVLTSHKYRTTAPHNQAWWDAIVKAMADGKATDKSLTEARVPARFVGYCVRRGYLATAK